MLFKNKPCERMIGSPMDLFLMMLGVFVLPAYFIMLSMNETGRNDITTKTKNFGFVYYVVDVLNMLGLCLVVMFIGLINFIRPKKHENNVEYYQGWSRQRLSLFFLF
jgi:hypothetical protein